MNENTVEKIVGEQKKGVFFQSVKAFLKRNSDMIVKMLVHQLGLTVFGFLLYKAASVSGSRPLVLGLGIFSAVFYLFLLYVLCWENGARDKIKIDGNRLKKDVFKGAKASLVANIPNLIFAVLSLVGYLCINKSVTDEAGRLVSPEWAANMYGIAQVVGAYLNSMYVGIGDFLGVVVHSWYLFATCAPTILVCGLGYYFGTNEKYGVFSLTK